MRSKFSKNRARVVIFGIGSFASAAMKILRENGAEVSCYLTRDYGHYGPMSEGPTFYYKQYPNPGEIIKKRPVDLVIPMSINWHFSEWTDSFLQLDVPIFSPTGEAMLLERDRDFARRLCHKYKIPFPRAHVARNRLEAMKFLSTHPGAYVIKNPLCSPNSPVHTIVCETEKDTASWLRHVDYAEGVFLQEYLGTREVGHVAFVSGGEIYPIVTNQEYKRAFDGNMGPVAGAPLGGLVEADPEDKYGLARELLYPLLPWFRESGFSGPVQVTAVKRGRKWYVIEYNVRTGVTTGPALWRMLKNPVQVLLNVSRNEKLDITFRDENRYACILTLAGWGYPYIKIDGPLLPVQVTEPFTCDVWWNEAEADKNGNIYMTGHRIADVIAHAPTLDRAIDRAYENIKKIKCSGSYYRLDIGQSLWPPGSD